MNEKVLKEKRVIIRLDDDLFNFVKEDADKYEMTVSGYIRMLLKLSKNLVEKNGPKC